MHIYIYKIILFITRLFFIPYLIIFNFNLALTISVSLIITLIYIISIYNTTFCPDTILAASPPDWACNPTQPVPEVNPGVEDAQAECLCNPIS